MPDDELLLEILRQIEESADKIIARSQSIHDVSDFTDSSSLKDFLTKLLCGMKIALNK
jgi:hypothetical protein